MTTFEIEEKKKTIALLKAQYDRTDIPTGFEARLRSRLFDNPQEKDERYRAFFPAWSTALVAVVGLAVSSGLFLMLKDDRPASAFQAVVTEARGTVFAQRDTSVHPIKKSATISSGTLVTTEKGGRLGMDIGPHRVVIGEGARLKLMRVEESHLAMRLVRGMVEISVAPLSSDQKLTIETSWVTVSVVGTVFSVEEAGSCTRVSVTKGLVEVKTQRNVYLLGRGEDRRFCEEGEPVAPVENQNIEPAAPVVPAATADRFENDQTSAESITGWAGSGEPVRETPTARTPSPAAEADTGETDITDRTASPNETGQGSFGEIQPIINRRPDTDDERLYEAAHEAILQGKTAEGDRLLREYLDAYPNGDFAEDALFRRVRLVYRQQRSQEVCALSETFLSRFPESSDRGKEVRILCAESALAMGQGSDHALQILAPLARDPAKLSERHRQQVTYLQFRATCEAGHHALCREWSARYLERYPKGRFAEEAEKNLKQP